MEEGGRAVREKHFEESVKEKGVEGGREEKAD